MMQWGRDNEQRALVLGCCLALAFILFAVFAKCSADGPVVSTLYEQLLEKKKVLAQLRVDMLHSIEMEKSAVMALTDGESQDFAQQSQQASALVDKDLGALRSMLQIQPMPNETKLLEEFAACWTELEAIDQQLLPLAVENTNLKAAALSRDQGGALLQRFEQELDDIRAQAVGVGQMEPARELTARALIAALKVYNVHGLHIIAAENGLMDRYEQQIQTWVTEVQQTLDTMEQVVGASGQAGVRQAKATFADFVSLTGQVVRLSRQNSNIKSLELSMGQKRKVSAKCDEVLGALQEAVASKPWKATK